MKKQTIIEYAIIAVIAVVGLIGCYLSVRTNVWMEDGSTKQHDTYFMERMLYDGVPYQPDQAQ